MKRERERALFPRDIFTENQKLLILIDRSKQWNSYLDFSFTFVV